MTAYTPAMSDPTAVMGRRIAAYAIDAVLLLVLVGVVVVPMVNGDAVHRTQGTRSAAIDFCDRINNESGPNAVCLPVDRDTYVLSRDNAIKAIDTFIGIAVGVWILNYMVLQGLVGGSVGKLLLGLRVVRFDGRRAGVGWCAVRTLLLVVDTAFCWIPGLVSSLSTKGHRRIGDLAAKTLVVPKAYLGQPLQVPGLTVPESAAYVGAGWPQPGGGYGTPPPGAPTGGWSAPPPPDGPGTAGTPDAGSVADGSAAGAAATPGADGPHWDEARGAYIQYDHGRGAWLQWDDTAKEWKQI